jgi:beta-phosphoglucomutase-like phosphatase (HAD superfamily)
MDVGTAESCTEAQADMRNRGLVFEDATLGCAAGVAAGMNGEYWGGRVEGRSTHAAPV